MNQDKLRKTCQRYIEFVYHNVNAADTAPVMEELMVMLYGDDIFDKLNKIMVAKDRGLRFDQPKFVDNVPERVYDVNPDGNPPGKSCRYCSDGSDTDWRGIDTKNVIVTCDFCRDGGQDY
ncbi:MAG: hypothetical protein KAS32_29520 [Candidatus Peribacteraceae bacterium]|nr:hypothetical protein [Candidatus Peribacteraceae bacterium]